LSLKLPLRLRRPPRPRRRDRHGEQSLHGRLDQRDHLKEKRQKLRRRRRRKRTERSRFCWPTTSSCSLCTPPSSSFSCCAFSCCSAPSFAAGESTTSSARSPAPAATAATPVRTWPSSNAAVNCSISNNPISRGRRPLPRAPYPTETRPLRRLRVDALGRPNVQRRTRHRWPTQTGCDVQMLVRETEDRSEQKRIIEKRGDEFLWLLRASFTSPISSHFWKFPLLLGVEEGLIKALSPHDLTQGGSQASPQILFSPNISRFGCLAGSKRARGSFPTKNGSLGVYGRDADSFLRRLKAFAIWRKKRALPLGFLLE